MGYVRKRIVIHDRTRAVLSCEALNVRRPETK
jgi:hypothetical protein